ncbi:MAG: DUF805 domain-containing protein [Lentisphaeria bacterium]|nr:DUF805 domain-containing protein [Lentisphaeria bacterium]
MNFNVLKDNFIDVVKNKYFCFEGVTGRTVFWRYMLVVFALQIAAGVLSSIVSIILAAAGLAFLGSLITAVVSLALLCPTIGITARRLHDIGRSGWLQLIAIIPVIGGLVVLILCLLPKSGEGCGCGCCCEQK